MSRGRLLGAGAVLVDGQVLSGDVRVGHDGTVEAVGVPYAGRRRTIVAPGLVDLQVNGFGGVDLRRADSDGYLRAGSALAAHGATAVQPTFFGLSVDGYLDALAALASVREEWHAGLARGAPQGCRYLAAHLEGPFLNPRFKGAHDERTFIDPSVVVADLLVDSGQVGFVTVAPELPGGLELVRHLVGRSVVVGIGHSDADVDTTIAATAAGARHLTHCWNAHRRLTSRDPGPAAVALVRPDLVVGLIADGVHVAAETVRLTLKAAKGRVAATTDAIAPAGLASAGPVSDDFTSDDLTSHDLARPAAGWDVGIGLGVTVTDGRATLADGTLAGSVATPIGLVQNLVRWGLDLAEALDACGGVQRRLLGLAEVRLRPGDVADLVVLDDDLSVLRTLVSGAEVFTA